MRFVCTYCQVCPIFLSSLVSDKMGNICMRSAELIVLKDVFDIELYLYWLLTAGIVLKECLYILNSWTLQLSDTKQV